MGKHLDAPLLVVAPQYVDRLDITGYTVDANARTLTLILGASRDDGAGGRVNVPFPNRTLDEVAATAVMAAATKQIVVAALTALHAPAAQIAQVAAAIAANPDLAQALYYAATRDQLYEAL